MDTIRGKVTDIIDGDTFDMSVEKIGKNNEYDYNNTERVRFSEIDAPELDTIQGQIAKADLEERILGAEVRVHIETRDTYGRVVGKVQTLVGDI